MATKNNQGQVVIELLTITLLIASFFFFMVGLGQTATHELAAARFSTAKSRP